MAPADPSGGLPARRRRRPHGPLALFLLSWLLFASAAAAWSIATPPWGAADEWAHQIKAAGLVRGQWTGSPDPAHPGADSPFTLFDLPAEYEELHHSPECYALQPQVPASCSAAVPDLPGEAPARTYVGHYPPLYYLLVAPAVLLPGGTVDELVGMRLLSALWSGLFLALACTAAAWRGRPLLAVAIAVAATPKLMSLSGVLNPNGLEDTAAIAAWTAGLLLVVDRPPPAAVRPLAALLALSLSVLACLRALSPVWCGLLVAVLLVAAAPGQVAAAARSRAVRAAALATATAGAAAAVWVLGADALRVMTDTRHAGEPLRVSLRGLGDRTPDLLSQMVGQIGWLDTPIGMLATVAWTAGGGLLVLLALAVGRARERVAVLLVVALVLVVPIALTLPEVETLGYAWQGRYGLPLAVGLPLLAALVVERNPELSPVSRRLGLVLVAVVGTGAVTAYLTALHRWAVGVDGELVDLGAAYQPAGSLLLVTCGGALAVGAVHVLLARLGGVSAVSHTAVHPTGAVQAAPNGVAVTEATLAGGPRR